MTSTDLVRHIDFSMKYVIELYIYDLTVLLAVRIYMRNPTKEDKVRTSAVMKHRWA